MKKQRMMFYDESDTIDGCYDKVYAHSHTLITDLEIDDYFRDALIEEYSWYGILEEYDYYFNVVFKVKEDNFNVNYNNGLQCGNKTLLKDVEYDAHKWQEGKFITKFSLFDEQGWIGDYEFNTLDMNKIEIIEKIEKA